LPELYRGETAVLEIIEAAGWPIWLLVATSVLGLALVIERALSLRTRHVFPARLPGQVLELLRQRNDNTEALLRLAGSSPLGRILAEVLVNRDETNAYRLAAIEDVGKDVAHRLNRYLPALATIAVVAPLMGLFGTVVGMIEIFASYTPAGGDPSQLARGISIALYNTGFGIIIAIPALIFHRYFRSRVDHLLHQMEREASALNRMIERGAQP
jgi:biopolymer transport protein ExbB